MTAHAALEQLLGNQTAVWRGWQGHPDKQPVIPTGFDPLDTLLPGGGWPAAALLSIDLPCFGVGELPLLLPAMSALSQAGRWIALVAPPFTPYAPALAQARVNLSQVLTLSCHQPADIPWALEKLLRHHACGMALAWPQQLANHQVRRLQLAAESGGALGVLFNIRRPSTRHSRHTASSNNGYAALQIELQRQTDGLAVRIHKARGSLQRHQLVLDL